MAVKRRRPRALRSAPAAERTILLLDTNVILDVILAREPWIDDAAALLDAAARGAVLGLVAGHTITTVYYLVERARDRRTAITAVNDLLQVVAVVPLASADFHRVLSLGLRDFEDAVQAAACLRAGAHFLVTRNHRAFRGAPVAVRSPSEARALVPPSVTE